MTAAQVIKVKSAQEKKIDVDQWRETKKLAEEISDLAKEVEKAADVLGPKLNLLNHKLTLAYQACPKKDTTMMNSPMAKPKINFALKRYLFKRGVMVDGVFERNLDAIKHFTHFVDEALLWLLKFS